jgi:hypothetical protein
LSRKLEHCCFLTFEQASQEHNLTIWKLQRVMMCTRLIFVDLPEDGGGIINGARVDDREPRRLASYFRSKGKLCSGK